MSREAECGGDEKAARFGPPSLFHGKQEIFSGTVFYQERSSEFRGEFRKKLTVVFTDDINRSSDSTIDFIEFVPRYKTFCREREPLLSASKRGSGDCSRQVERRYNHD